MTLRKKIRKISKLPTQNDIKAPKATFECKREKRLIERPTLDEKKSFCDFEDEEKIAAVGSICMSEI